MFLILKPPVSAEPGFSENILKQKKKKKTKERKKESEDCYLGVNDISKWRTLYVHTHLVRSKTSAGHLHQYSSDVHRAELLAFEQLTTTP